MKDIFTLRQEALEKIGNVLAELDSKAQELDPFCLLERSIDEQRKAAAIADAIIQIRASLGYCDQRSKVAPVGPFKALIDPDFELPGRQLLEKIFSNYETGDIAAALRVERRAISRWITGDARIPETCWRQFLIAAGEVVETPYQILKKDE